MKPVNRRDDDDDDGSMRLNYDAVRVRDPNAFPDRLVCTNSKIGVSFLRIPNAYFAALTYHGRIPIDFTKPWSRGGVRTEPNILPFEVIVYDADMNLASASNKRTFEDAKREFEEYVAKGDAIGLVHIAGYGRGHPMLLDTTKRVTISEPVRISVPSKDPEEEQRRLETLEIPTDVSDGDDDDDALPVRSSPPPPPSLEESKKRERPKEKEEAEADDDEVEIEEEDEEDDEQFPSSHGDDNGKEPPREIVIGTRTPSIYTQLSSTEKLARIRADSIEQKLHSLKIDHRTWIADRSRFKKRYSTTQRMIGSDWKSIFTPAAIGWAWEVCGMLVDHCWEKGRVYTLTRTNDLSIWIKKPGDAKSVRADEMIDIPTTLKCRCRKGLFPKNRRGSRPVLFHPCEGTGNTATKLCGRCMVLSWMVSVCLAHSDTEQPSQIRYVDTMVACESLCHNKWNLTDLAILYADHKVGIPVTYVKVNKMARATAKRRGVVLSDDEEEEEEDEDVE